MRLSLDHRLLGLMNNLEGGLSRLSDDVLKLLRHNKQSPVKMVLCNELVCAMLVSKSENREQITHRCIVARLMSKSVSTLRLTVLTAVGFHW